MRRDGRRNRRRRPIGLSAAQGGDVIGIPGEVANKPQRTQTHTSEPFRWLRLRLITGTLGGPTRSSHEGKHPDQSPRPQATPVLPLALPHRI